jgi:hypothetical protein
MELKFVVRVQERIQRMGANNKIRGKKRQNHRRLQDKVREFSLLDLKYLLNSYNLDTSFEIYTFPYPQDSIMLVPYFGKDCKHQNQIMICVLFLWVQGESAT